MNKKPHDAKQLGFDALLSDAAEQNRLHEFERETAHLPAMMDEAIPFFRELIQRHHAAMFAADVESAFALREEADKLAMRLNGGEPGILAGDDAPGRVLERVTAAARGEVPLWGQTGDFIVTVAGIQVRIELDGVFGISANFGFWPGFAAHCVDPERPFISETGYRSFLGLHAEVVPGMTPDSFCRAALESYIERELKGKLVAVDPKYRGTDE